MKATTAIALIAELIYKPEWTFETRDLCDRFEETITLRVSYPARNFNRDQAPDYPTAITPSAVFPIMVKPFGDATELYAEVIKIIMRIEDHEAREALRVRGSLDAPFHPHNHATMRRWAELTGHPVERDLLFGAV